MLLMAAGGAAAATLARPGSAGASDTATASYDAPILAAMGTVGVTPAETARLSIVMHAENPAGWMLCDGFLSFNSIAGQQLASAKFSITSGQGAFVDWTPRGKLQRTQVYPVVTLTTDMSVGDYSEVVMGASFEVFDRLSLATRTCTTGIFCTALGGV